MRKLALALVAAAGASCAPVDDTPRLTFPDGFQWGVAGAAHQSEGGPRVDNDWTLFAEMGRAPPVGRAQDFWNRYETDFDNAAGIGLNAFQLGIEWARVVPTAPADPFAPLTRADPSVDVEALEHYHAMIDAARARGLEPVVAATHFSLPRWVSDPSAYDAEANAFAPSTLGGWTHNDTARALAVWCAFLVEEFGDDVRTWITIDEPLVVLLAGYLTGDFPPGLASLSLEEPAFPGDTNAVDIMRNMIDAHARSYHAMKAVRDDITVTIAHNSVVWEPAVPGVDDEAAQRVHEMYNLAFLDALTTGDFPSTLRFDGPIEHHDEWARTLDVIGVNYYDRNYVVDVPGLLPPLEAFPCSPALESSLPTLYEISGCPVERADEAEGMTQMLLAYHQRYGLPMLVTENGFIDTPDGKAAKLHATARAMRDAIDGGADVIGYHYWTLVFDYEWNSGWTEDMGLYTMAGLSTLPEGAAPGDDFDFTRVPLQPAVDAYRALIAGAVPR